MFAILLYSLAAIAVFWAYWFFILKRSKRLVNLIDIHSESQHPTYLLFSGILNTADQEYCLIALDVKRWKFFKSNGYKNHQELFRDGIQEISTSIGFSFMMESDKTEIPFPVLFDEEYRSYEDAVVIRSQGNSFEVSLIRNSTRINAFHVKGRIDATMKKQYMKGEQAIVFIYEKGNEGSSSISFFVLDLLNGNLSGKADL